MTYFEKIEAYLSGDMNEMEQSIFEQALAENTSLQKEYEAYKTAQSLFGFTAETLSEAEITTSNATETTEQVINFTAQNLSEQEILGTVKPVTTERQAIVKRLKTKKNRIEWLVAASMLFVLSLIGAQFYNNSTVKMLNTPTEMVVKKTIEPKVESPVEKEIVVPTPIIAEPEVKIVKKIAKKKAVSKKYEPANIKITPKATPAIEQQPIAAIDKAVSNPLLTATTISKPMAILTTAEKIVTGKVIQKGESIIYTAGNSITLKPGFHAKTGSDFVATATLEKETATDLTKMEVIDQQQAVVYNAAHSITLKPGFHAKAGSDFVAKTAKSSSSLFISTNMVVSEQEAIEVKADGIVTLKAGFHAKAGASFLAKVKK